ncbi:MAG: ABC transporter permease [Ignavibacteria bacterium]|jgi:putative ABC transport system permease protein
MINEKVKKKNYKPPFIAEFLMKFFFPDCGKFTTLGDLQELYNYKVKTKGKLKANWWYRKEVINSIVPFLMNSILWSINMFQNYMKISLRNFRRQKLFTFINVFGLAIGLAACMIISLWVQNELSYDSFHKKADRIYRVEREIIRDEINGRWPITSAKYKQALIDDYPEIINAVRFWPREFSIKDVDNYLHREALFAADNSIFEIFDFDFIQGSQETALSKPKTLVLTTDAAVKYFGNTDVLGKSLELEWEDDYVNFEITGLLKDIPGNSHIHFDMLISFASYSEEDLTSWRSNYLYTYVLIDNGVQHKEFEKKIKSFIDQHLKPQYGDLILQGRSIHEVLKLQLFPLKYIHLNPSENWELEPGGSFESVILFSSIGFLLLIIAGINFINLSTARANRRSKEVSLRKTLGAVKRELRIQFIHESLLLTFISAAIAFAMLYLLIPYYNSIFSENLSILKLTEVNNLLFFLGAVLVIGLAASLYPAYYLSKFEPAEIIRGGALKYGGKSLFRRNMVVFQFTISISLLAGMYVMYSQMRYIQTKPMGFKKENIIIFPARSSKVPQNFEVFKSRILSNSSNIISATGSGDLPGDRIFGNGNLYYKNEIENHISSVFMSCDYDFISTYKIPVIAGRNFSKEFSTDTAGAIILNETAARKFGLTPEKAIGKVLTRGHNINLTIAGVIEDFNFQSLMYNIEPMAFLLEPNYITAISVRVAPGNITETINSVKKIWEKTFQGELFEYSFLDKRIEQLYESEQKAQSIIIVFTAMSIIVACLGLFGLAAYTAEEKTREIGIRKTLGATVPSIFYSLTKDYIKWIVISTLIACPVSFYLMNGWLENFAYRITLNFLPFIFSAVAAILISLTTVSYQSIKAALANPIDCIRAE